MNKEYQFISKSRTIFVIIAKSLKCISANISKLYIGVYNIATRLYNCQIKIQSMMQIRKRQYIVR